MLQDTLFFASFNERTEFFFTKDSDNDNSCFVSRGYVYVRKMLVFHMILLGKNKGTTLIYHRATLYNLDKRGFYRLQLDEIHIIHFICLFQFLKIYLF